MTNEQERYQRALENLSRKLTDEGKLIEAGWMAYRASCVPHDAGELQVRDMRATFFAGAQHLYGSIMTMLEPDAEPTDNDLRRMALIDDEMNRFIAEYSVKWMKTEGRA